jgi:hypothetical protein
MDLRAILNSLLPLEQLDAPDAYPEPPRTPPHREYALETTRTDRIKIRAFLDWALPRSIRRRYGYILRQIRLAQDAQTPRRKGRCGPKLKIKPVKRKELKE